MNIKIIEIAVEKPLTTIEDEIRKLLAAAEAEGKRLEIGLVTFFESNFHRSHGVIVHYHECPKPATADATNVPPEGPEEADVVPV